MTTNELYLFRPLLRFLGEKMLNDADEVKICLNHCFAEKLRFLLLKRAQIQTA